MNGVVSNETHRRFAALAEKFGAGVMFGLAMVGLFIFFRRAKDNEDRKSLQQGQAAAVKTATEKLEVERAAAEVRTTTTAMSGGEVQTDPIRIMQDSSSGEGVFRNLETTWSATTREVRLSSLAWHKVYMLVLMVAVGLGAFVIIPYYALARDVRAFKLDARKAASVSWENYKASCLASTCAPSILIKVCKNMTPPLP